jgi:hypothetical protein
VRHAGADVQSRLFTAAWLLLAASLCVAIATWGINIGRALGPVSQTAPSIVVPRATAVPSIVTDFTPDGTATLQSLCAEISPAPAVVIVESPTGTVMSTTRCPPPDATSDPDMVTIYSDIGPPNPSTLCSEVSPSTKVVTVETFTGVVLSRVQCPTG